MKFAIDTREKICFKSNKYFLRIRTCDESNPVVLFLHGGCGSPDRAQVMEYQSPLAEQFTLVAFDQRGAGYAYDGKEAKSLDLTKEIYVEDVHNVVDYLKKDLKKTKLSSSDILSDLFWAFGMRKSIPRTYWHMSALVNASTM